MKRLRMLGVGLLLMAALVSFAACGGTTTTDDATPTPRPNGAYIISPANDSTFQVGQTITFTVQAWKNGAIDTHAEAGWSYTLEADGADQINMTSSSAPTTGNQTITYAFSAPGIYYVEGEDDYDGAYVAPDLTATPRVQTLAARVGDRKASGCEGFCPWVQVNIAVNFANHAARIVTPLPGQEVEAAKGRIALPLSADVSGTASSVLWTDSLKLFRDDKLNDTVTFSAPANFACGFHQDIITLSVTEAGAQPSTAQIPISIEFTTCTNTPAPTPTTPPASTATPAPKPTATPAPKPTVAITAPTSGQTLQAPDGAHITVNLASTVTGSVTKYAWSDTLGVISSTQQNDTVTATTPTGEACGGHADTITVKVTDSHGQTATASVNVTLLWAYCVN